MSDLWHLDTCGVREDFIRGNIDALEAGRKLVLLGMTPRQAIDHLDKLVADLMDDVKVEEVAS